jgi:hypothetical protein
LTAHPPADGYFIRLDEHRYRPTDATSGAWNPAEQHISPMNGLIVHAMERFCAERGTDDTALSRISIDILGTLPLEPFDLRIEVVRPGRTIELLEAVVTSGKRPAVRARIWRTIATDTARVAGGEAEPLPGADHPEPLVLSDVWPGGYIDSIEVRPIGTPKPGRAAAWIAPAIPLVADEPASDLARLMGLVDTANGLCVREPIETWLFPNVDLTIHLLRQPAGLQLGLDTTVTFGPTGLGVTASVLHDAAGHFGYAQQSLTIRPRH